jgi:xylulokinase
MSQENCKANQAEDMADAYLIGLDVGTTSVKGALFDESGKAIKTVSARHETKRPAQAYAEQNPDEWMAHVLDALSVLTEGLPTGAVAAVGVTSQVNTHVFVGADGEPLMPAIIWQDGRCADEAAALDLQVPESDRLRWWGAPLPIDASHVLSRIAWVKRHHPDLWQKTRWVMAPKDYCIYRLTGEVTADPMSNFGVIDQSLDYIPSLISLVPGAIDRLPPLSSFSASAGRIQSGLPGAGAAMVTGTMDAWAGILGAGGVKNGDAVYLSGTSEVLGLISPQKVPTPGVISFPQCEGIVLHAGPTQAGGASVEWLSSLLGRSPAELSALAASVPSGRPVPVFLPHLQGERAPLWNITSRAAFAGMDSSTGPAELSRAVFEGVAYSVRLLLESLEQSAAMRPSSITIAGGGAQSEVWCQIRADILGRPIHRVAHTDSGVLGAAMIAGVGAGIFPSIAKAAEFLVHIDRTFFPEETQQKRHNFSFGKFRELYGQLKDFNAGFTSFGGW